MKIFWHKLDEKATIPTKRDEDAGFDVYTIDNDIVLEPFSKHLFRTGLSVVLSKGWWLMAFDRGSTGSKGIHTHCGVIDNGYRGEIFICLSNDNNFPIKFTNTVDKIVLENNNTTNIMYYPVSKAIAQLIPIQQPEVVSSEINDDEWKLISDNTERGTTKLGQSGK